MAQTRPSEIIVVDSGSTDRTREIASRFPARLLHIAPERFSFGRSLNLGCEVASGDVLVAVSAHCYPLYTDWLERLLAPFDDPGVAISYGRQQGGASTQFSEHRVFATWFPDQSDFDQRHPFCNNANAAVRRSVWERIGFDEALTGLEDLAFARAAMAAGHKIAYVAEAPVVHLHNETWRQVFNRYQREGIAFHRIFPEDRFSVWDFVSLLAVNVFADARAAWSEERFARKLSDIMLFRLMQFAGTYRGRNRAGTPTRELRRRFYYPSYEASRRPPAGSGKPAVDYGAESEVSG